MSKLDKKISNDIKPYKFDDYKKSEFVEVYRELRGHITDTCRAVGISRQTYYDALEKDKDFAMSLLESEAELNDDIRNVLIQKAADGDMTAVIFYLKNRHPDFKQQTGVYIKGDKMEMAFIDRDGKEINSNFE